MRKQRQQQQQKKKSTGAKQRPSTIVSAGRERGGASVPSLVSLREELDTDLAFADLALSFLLSGEERLAERVKTERGEEGKMLVVAVLTGGHRTLCAGRKPEESQVAVETEHRNLVERNVFQDWQRRQRLDSQKSGNDPQWK